MLDLTQSSLDQLIEMRANTRWSLRQLEALGHATTLEQDTEKTRLRTLQARLAREIGRRVVQLPLC